MVWTRWKVSGAAGVLFVALSLVAAGLNSQPPAPNNDAAAFAGWLSASGDRFRFWHFIAGVAFLLFYFPFFAGLCERLREAEGAPAIWSRVAWAGAIMSPAAGTTSGAFIVAVTMLGEPAAAEVAVFAAAAQHYAYVVSGAFAGVVMIGAAVVILSTGVFWRWLGWTAALIATAAVAGSAAIVENDREGLFANVSNLAWLAYFLWIGAASIAMLRMRDHRAAP
jgi:hypothetical protein